MGVGRHWQGVQSHGGKRKLAQRTVGDFQCLVVYIVHQYGTGDPGNEFFKRESNGNVYLDVRRLTNTGPGQARERRPARRSLSKCLPF